MKQSHSEHSLARTDALQVEADRIADSEDESAERIECVGEICFGHLDGHHNTSFCDFALTHSCLHVQTEVSRRVIFYCNKRARGEFSLTRNSHDLHMRFSLLLLENRANSQSCQ